MEDGERLDSRQVFRGRIVDLWVERVKLPNGHVSELELVRHPGSAAILPVDRSRDVVLVRQYRHATGSWLLEAPAGTLDRGEAPETCAVRELAEEVGLAAGRFIRLGWIWTAPGFTDEKIWLYLATDLTPVPQALEEDEVLRVERVPFADAIERARSGEIVDAKTVAALFRAAYLL
jgi:ADP-ribose pyrophosphatase